MRQISSANSDVVSLPEEPSGVVVGGGVAERFGNAVSPPTDSIGVAVAPSIDSIGVAVGDALADADALTDGDGAAD